MYQQWTIFLQISTPDFNQDAILAEKKKEDALLNIFLTFSFICLSSF